MRCIARRTAASYVGSGPTSSLVLRVMLFVQRRRVEFALRVWMLLQDDPLHAYRKSRDSSLSSFSEMGTSFSSGMSST